MKTSEKSEKSSEKSEMSEVAWASDVLRGVIAPPGSAGSKGERIRAAAIALRWKFSRVRDIWYADERVAIKPRELRRIEEVSGVTYGRQEVDELNGIIARADALLAGQDQDIRRAIVGAVLEALGSLAGARVGGDAR